MKKLTRRRRGRKGFIFSFAILHGITDSNLGNYLGSWGVDTADNQVWAVINYNSSSFASYFGIASVPEPGSLALIGASAAACLLRLRRRQSG